MRANAKDLGAGLLFVLTGLTYGSIAWFRLEIGQALSMGPGYFPLVLSGALTILGLAIAARGFVDTEGRIPFGVVPWRGVFFLSLATLVFAAFVDDLGLFPTVALTAFLACLSNPKVAIASSLVTSICIAIFCTAVFSFGIRLPIPVIGPWIIG